MEEGGVGFFQGAFRGLLRCLGLASAGERDAAPLEQEEAIVNNPPPQATYEQDPSTTDPLVEALTSSDDKPVVSTRDINIGGDSDLSVLSRGTTGEAHYVELVDNGKPNMTLLNTRLISSGGGGKNH